MANVYNGPVVASRVLDNTLKHLTDRAYEDAPRNPAEARALGFAIQIVHAASTLAFHEESFNRVVESYRQ